jgi:hypothetical protein
LTLVLKRVDELAKQPTWNQQDFIEMLKILLNHHSKKAHSSSTSTSKFPLFSAPSLPASVPTQAVVPVPTAARAASTLAVIRVPAVVPVPVPVPAAASATRISATFPAALKRSVITIKNPEDDTQNPPKRERVLFGSHVSQVAQVPDQMQVHVHAVPSPIRSVTHKSTSPSKANSSSFSLESEHEEDGDVNNNEDDDEEGNKDDEANTHMGKTVLSGSGKQFRTRGAMDWIRTVHDDAMMLDSVKTLATADSAVNNGNAVQLGFRIDVSNVNFEQFFEESFKGRLNTVAMQKMARQVGRVETCQEKLFLVSYGSAAGPHSICAFCNESIKTYNAEKDNVERTRIWTQPLNYIQRKPTGSTCAYHISCALLLRAAGIDKCLCLINGAQPKPTCKQLFASSQTPTFVDVEGEAPDPTVNSNGNANPSGNPNGNPNATSYAGAEAVAAAAAAAAAETKGHV